MKPSSRSSSDHPETYDDELFAVADRKLRSLREISFDIMLGSSRCANSARDVTGLAGRFRVGL